MSDFTFKKHINRKLSSIEESIISSFNKSVKSRKSNSIDNNEEFIPYYKYYLKYNLKLNSSLIIRRKEFNVPFCYEEKRFKWQKNLIIKINLNFLKIKIEKKEFI